MGLFEKKEGKTAVEWFELVRREKDPVKAVEYLDKMLGITSTQRSCME